MSGTEQICGVNSGASIHSTVAPDPARPQTYPRRVLLAVTGLSPQVVTETLYGLVCQEKCPFVPTEVRILTTSEGAERARLMLLDPRSGQFHRFCADFGLDSDTMGFTDSSIYTFEGPDGRELPDIDSEVANTAVADAITVAVQELTGDPDCALHASIAGGRKTMGFYLGSALSLFGRTQDRLSHVLVTSPFESDPQFFFPPAEPRVLVVRGRPVHTSNALVMLTEIPFVRLRHGTDLRLTQGAATYSEIVATAQLALGPPQLDLDLVGGCVRASGQVVPLAPARLALLAVFARRTADGYPALSAPSKGVPDPQWRDRYLRQYHIIRGTAGDTDATERALRPGMDGEYFSSQLSKLRRELRRSLSAAAAPFLIDDGGQRPHRYRLDLPASAVRFIAITTHLARKPAGESGSNPCSE